MAFSVSWNIYGLDETRRYIDGMPKRINQRTLTTLGRWGRQFKQLGVMLSPSDKLRVFDARRRKNKQFRLQWQYDVSSTDTEGVLRVGNVDPRMPWIIWPTKPRGVIPHGGAMEQWRRGYPLRFYTASGAMHQQWEVRRGIASQGTPGNPVHEKMLERFNLEGALINYATWIVQP